MTDVHTRRHGYVECGAPLWHQPDRLHARVLRDDIGPRSRCVDDVRGMKNSRLGRDGPPSARSLYRTYARIDQYARTSGLRRSQKTLMQSINVHFHGMRLDKCACNTICAQNRHSGDRSVDVDARDARYQNPCMLEILSQPVELLLSCDRDHATGRQQRMLAEPRRRISQKVAACDSEPADDGAPVVLGKACRRPSRRVIAAPALALEDDHGSEHGELVGGSCTGYAA